jgi:hypothetical protein
MEAREPLETLRRDLLRRGLPAIYVGRAVQELADHHADVVADDETADAAAAAWRQIGDVAHLGNELVHKYRQQTFAGRHPLLTFVIAPLPAVLLVWAATLAIGWHAVFLIAPLVWSWQEGQTVSEMDPRMVWTLLTFHYASLIVPPAASALWFCRLTRKSGRGLVWGAASCVLVALLAFVLISDFRLPYEAHQGRLLLGLALPLPADWPALNAFGLWQLLRPERQLLQALAPLAVLAIAAWRAGAFDRIFRSRSARRAVV